MQSSTEVVPQRAVDGSTSAAFSTSTCSLTRPERAPWWYVNLLEPYMVQLVRLDFGKSCCGQQGAATVVVRVGNSRPDLGSNPICNRFTGPLTEGRPLFLPCNPPMPGAFVSVHLETQGGPAQLSLCEAFVYTDQALPMERCPQFRDAPPGSMATYNGKCYAFHSRTALPFREALAYCRARGGTLVDESNPALQGFISWELWRRHRSDSGSQYWLGAVRDPADRNNWKWLGGGDVTVSFWNLPGGDQDCARYDGAKGWLWSDTPCDARLAFICQHQPTACGRPEQPPNSTLAAPAGFAVGAEVRVACDPGHLLVGPALRSCLPTGFYDEFPPVCKRVECGLPASIAHGFYQLLDAGSVGLGARVRYACDEGFALRGRALLTCDADERWDGPPPACLPVRCEPPPPIANGRFSAGAGNHSGGVRAGGVVQYSCARRFVLHGPRALTCLPSGRYDLDPPVCREEAASPVPVPAPAPSPSTPGARPTGTAHPAGTRPAAPPAPKATPPPPPPPPPAPAPTRAPSPAPAPKPTRRPPPHIIGATHSGPPAHPQDNEVPDSAHVRNTGSPGANLVPPLEEERREPGGARLNLGAIIALGVFGGFVFLAAIITTIVILIRRSRSAKHYRHRASPDCNTVASFDSSGSEGRAGLNRYYRQAWENLHHQAGGGGGKNALRRQETLDEPVRGAGELLVTTGMSKPAPPQQEKKRHHHHHHHHGPSSSGTKETSNAAGDWRNRPSKNRY
ncbi:hypothetical protein R5R35_006183 [Gryllus longicercus]|uniref:Uncharacterized protein n=1 Tax=Gryllus longicercus TaxID=2509291 RepID=A0AAN9Z5L6_9ORTH